MTTTAQITSPLRSINRQLDELVDDTAADRDRTVDFIRAAAIVVVVLWHWTLSVTHWEGGELIMPNPVAEVPFGWLPTWLLQVMPVFFFVGGFANLAAWESGRRKGQGALAFYRRRMRRLLPPVGVFVGVWVAVELIAFAVVPGYRGVVEYGMIAFIPLWFLAAYLWVILLVPATARAHDASPALTIGGMAAAIVLLDVGRFGLGIEAAGWVNTALVWVFAHQVGYFYRDGSLTSPSRALRAGVALVGLLALAVITSLPVYPRSMVAVEGVDVSHMYPTTVGVAALVVFQAGVVVLARPRLNRWLGRRRVWKTVIAVNAVIMTIFLWHMTAKLLGLATLTTAGVPLLEEPTALWWGLRPLFLVVPGVFLVLLVILFRRFETGSLAQ